MSSLPDKPKILALETSTLAMSVALLDGEGKVLAGSDPGPGETHSRTLLPEVERLLDGLGLKAADLSLVAVGIGPGSFTGLRIGLSAAKGLSWAAGAGLAGIPSLDILAHALPPGDLRICPLMEARKNLVYAAIYEPAETGLKRLTDYMSMTIPDLADFIREETLFIGPGVRGRKDELEGRLGGNFVRGPENLDYPRAGVLGRLALDAVSRGEDTDPRKVVPLYVRPPDIRPQKEAVVRVLGET